MLNSQASSALGNWPRGVLRLAPGLAAGATKGVAFGEHRQDPDDDMSNESFDRLTGPVGDLTPSQYLGLKFRYFFPLSLAIPVFFLIIKWNGVDVLPSAVADEIVFVLSSAWPVLQEQFDAIKKLSSVGDAANYALFFLCLLLFGFYMFVNVILDHAKIKEVVKNTSWRDVVLTVILSMNCFYPVLFDRVKNNPKPLWNFYVDGLGLYYIRQYILVMGVLLAILLLEVLITGAVIRLKSFVIRRSNTEE